MMRLIMLIAAAAMFVFAGCDPKLPTVEQMELTSKTIGVAAGLVANQVKIDSETRTAIAEVMKTVSEVVPAKDQSFEDAWTPVAKEVVAKLVAEGKLKEGQDVLVLGAFKVAVKALDYEFTVRYPQAKEVTELVTAAIRGFSTGFLSTFTPEGAFKAAPGEYDKAAYDYLTK